jgi:SAM-dependent methyltransferase
MLNQLPATIKQPAGYCRRGDKTGPASDDKKDMDDDKIKQLADIRQFYDAVYYQSATTQASPTGHHRRLARHLGITRNQKILDVACGVGNWLLACSKRGASVAGVDISEKAIAICRNALPDGDFSVQSAETLPFADCQFDIVTCLGSLEHFVDPLAALKEMLRVARKDARFVILVPNADFLTRKLGLFTGTQQVDAREDVRTLESWEKLFIDAGLCVNKRWKDLHVLSWQWISDAPWYRIPTRMLQAIALTIWPLKWQYQVYHLCSRKPS